MSYDGQYSAACPEWPVYSDFCVNVRRILTDVRKKSAHFVRNGNPKFAAVIQCGCMETDDVLAVDKEHSYCAQIQLKITSCPLCDFVTLFL